MAKPLKTTSKIFAIATIFLLSCSTQNRQNTNEPLDSVISSNGVFKVDRDSIPTFLIHLQKCYPHEFLILNSKHIRFYSGDTILVDDGKRKSIEDKIADADIEDQFAIKYPKGSNFEIPTITTQDPGRIRNEFFFKQLYGSTKKQVESQLKTIRWLPSHTDIELKVHRKFGIADSLEKVSQALEALPDSLLKYVTKTAGTFKWRTIAGTNRLSNHSFGIAIDINTEFSNYWKWEKELQYKNQIPIEIVLIFEKYGFIWGGKWYHYDTMHFEFRPELL